jgi:predicted ester cyclase
MSAANKRIVAVVNQVLSGELELVALDGVVADDFKDHAAFPGQRLGRDGLKDAIRALRAAFDQRVRSLHTVSEDDLIIDHWVSEGLHRGEFMAIEPTGRSGRLERFSVWRVIDGRAVEAWGLVDVAGLMRQLTKS